MKNRIAAKYRFIDSVKKNFGRTPTNLEINSTRIALKHNDCFLVQDCGSIIKGIVKFRNIYISVIYDKKIDGMISAGIPLTVGIK